MVRLIYNQNLKILVPATLFFFVEVCALLIGVNDSGTFSYSMVYTPLCYKSTDPDIVEFFEYFSYLLYNLTLIPFLLFYRFYVQASYQSICIFIKIFMEAKFHTFKCFSYEVDLAMKTHEYV